MNFLKGLLLVLAITSITCQNAKLFDMNEMYEQGTLLNFLEETKLKAGGAPVTLSQCLENGQFKVTKMTVDPNEVIKGQNIRIKVVGVMLTDQLVNKIHLDTFYNEKIIYNNDVDKGNAPIKKGTYGFDYEASVPTFTPSGKWEIFLYLLNDQQEKLSCIKCTFEMA